MKLWKLRGDGVDGGERGELDWYLCAISSSIFVERGTILPGLGDLLAWGLLFEGCVGALTVAAGGALLAAGTDSREARLAAQRDPTGSGLLAAGATTYFGG